MSLVLDTRTKASQRGAKGSVSSSPSRTSDYESGSSRCPTPAGSEASSTNNSPDRVKHTYLAFWMYVSQDKEHFFDLLNFANVLENPVRSIVHKL